MTPAHYLVSIQVAIPANPHNSSDWRIEFRPVGQLTAGSAEGALLLARSLGWRSPVVQPVPAELGAATSIPTLERAPLAHRRIKT